MALVHVPGGRTASEQSRCNGATMTGGAPVVQGRRVCRGVDVARWCALRTVPSDRGSAGVVVMWPVLWLRPGSLRQGRHEACLSSTQRWVRCRCFAALRRLSLSLRCNVE